MTYLARQADGASNPAGLVVKTLQAKQIVPKSITKETAGQHKLLLSPVQSTKPPATYSPPQQTVRGIVNTTPQPILQHNNTSVSSLQTSPAVGSLQHRTAAVSTIQISSAVPSVQYTTAVSAVRNNTAVSIVQYNNAIPSIQYSSSVPTMQYSTTAALPRVQITTTTPSVQPITTVSAMEYSSPTLSPLQSPARPRARSPPQLRLASPPAGPAQPGLDGLQLLTADGQLVPAEGLAGLTLLSPGGSLLQADSLLQGLLSPRQEPAAKPEISAQQLISSIQQPLPLPRLPAPALVSPPTVPQLPTVPVSFKAATPPNGAPTNIQSLLPPQPLAPSQIRGLRAPVARNLNFSSKTKPATKPRARSKKETARAKLQRLEAALNVQPLLAVTDKKYLGNQVRHL